MNWKEMKSRLLNRQPAVRCTMPPAAVLVLLAGEELVLEVRSGLLRTQPGEICLPGGRMEQGETPEQCALRETWEELGLPGEAITVIGRLDWLVHRQGQFVCPVLARMAPEMLNRLRPNRSEVEQVFTVPMDWFLQNPPRRYCYQMQPLAGPDLPEQIFRWVSHYPNHREGLYWNWQGRVIWGLTASVIDLFCALREGRGDSDRMLVPLITPPGV